MVEKLSVKDFAELIKDTNSPKDILRILQEIKLSCSNCDSGLCLVGCDVCDNVTCESCSIRCKKCRKRFCRSHKDSIISRDYPTMTLCISCMKESGRCYYLNSKEVRCQNIAYEELDNFCLKHHPDIFEMCDTCSDEAVKFSKCSNHYKCPTCGSTTPT